MNYVSLGQRIRKKRQTLHWTQAQLAQAVGLSVSFLGHIERGSRKASLETLVSICNVLDISPAYLLEESLTITDKTPMPDALNDRQRVALNQIVHYLDTWNESGSR